MRANAIRRFWVALAILPLLGGLAFASSPAMFTCRGDLVARTSCCCPVGEHATSASGGAASTLSAACCCDISQMKAPAPSAVAEVRAAAQITLHPDLAPVALRSLVEWPPTFHTWPTARMVHQAPPAIPILLSKQSFLI